MPRTDLLPQTRGKALHNRANNFPIGTTDKQAFDLVSDNASAAWVHHNGHAISRFALKVPHVIAGPKATLMYVSNGPIYFAREWRRLFVHEVIAKDRKFFSGVPPDVLKLIVMYTETRSRSEMAKVALANSKRSRRAITD